MEWYHKVFVILGILFILFMFIIYILSKTENSNKCYEFKWLFTKPIAHRGYYNNGFKVIENTPLAFNEAIKRNYNIETDLSLTKDNKIIVFHDNDFKRLCGVDKKVSELTLEEIMNFSLLNTDEKIMEFSDFLKLIDGRCSLLLEFKSTTKERNNILCLKAMELLKDYQGNYAIQSFDPNLVRWFKKNYPIIPRGQLYMKFNLKECKKEQKGKGFQGFLTYLTRVLYNNKLVHLVSRPHFITHEYETLDLMARILHLTTPLLVWTIKTKKDYEKVIKKVDNVIFENLDFNNDGTIK